MRIRTDGDYGHREDTIEAAADRLDCNKTRAVLVSCDVVGRLLENIENALEDEELSPRLRNKLAGKISTRQINVEVDQPDASIQVE